MALPTTTIWEADPHTIAKHVILKNYLEAWFPILSSWHGRVIYYDGFAGPGIYSRGEQGSPLIALDVARKHRARLDAELTFVFVEAEEARARKLEENIGQLSLPSNFKWKVINEPFAAALSKTLDHLDQEKLEIAPTFAFVDPFGITGLPFSLVCRLLQRERCEIFVNFMNSTIKRFVTELPDQVNVLIGNPEASEIIAKSNDRTLTARQLYEESLRRAARFIRFFEIRDKSGKPIYDLFFASNHPLGHYRMKEAMWKVDESGDYYFSDGVNPAQSVLFSPNPSADLARLLWEHFKEKSVDAANIMEYTRNDTPYLERHAREALKRLESEDGIDEMCVQVAATKKDGTKRKKGSYPEGALIEFSRRRGQQKLF